MNRCLSVHYALPPRRSRGLLYFVRNSIILTAFGAAALSAQVASNSATGLSYASIQAAVDAWGSNYTVFVLANTAAAVSVNSKTNLLIVGTNNVSPFRITGAGTGTGLTITNRSRNVAVSNLIVERFAIGVAIDRCESNEINLIVRSNQNSASAGAGVHLNYATNNIIGGFIYYNTNISGANSYGGAGVYAQYSVSNTVRALVASNLVTNTTGVPSGGGIYIVSGRFNTVSGDVVANQISNSVGGGIDIDYGFGNVITGNVIRNGSFNGGGIYLYYCTNTTINASVISNTSAAGGAAGISLVGSVSNTVIGAVIGNIGTNASYYCYGSGIQMKSCFSNYINANISYNRGGDDGAAIYGSNVHFGTYIVAMTNNTANNGSGGGIYFDLARSNFISGTAVSNICSNGFGGGIGLSSAQSNRITLDCYGNIANSGGAVFLDYCTNTYVSNVMAGNFAPQGSGAYIWYGRSNDFYGTACSNSDWEGFYSSGAFTFANAQSNIVSSEIFDNRLVSSYALGGGAIYCTNAHGNYFDGSYMRNNVDASGSSGGAVYLRYSDNNVITASLLSNVAQFGGGICLDYGKTNAIDGYSYGNRATNGGAIYAYVSSNVTVRGTYGASESFRTFFLQSALFGNYSNVSVVDDRSTMSVFYMTNAMSGKFLDSMIIAPEATAFDIINTSNCIFSNCLIASSPADAFIFSNAGTNSILFCTITNNRGGIAHSASSSNRIYNNNINNVMMNILAGSIGSYAASNWYGTRAFDGMRLVKTNYGITPWRNAFGGRNGDWVLPPPPGGCVAATNTTLGQIVIKWGLSAPADFSNYQVYRTLSESFSNLTDADRVFIGFNSTVTQYTENAVPGGVYRYYVTTADTNGNESMYSPMGIVTNNTIVASNASIGGTFTNLQLAINAAAAGNTIVVYRTRHIGNFIIDKNLTLRSRDWIDFGDKTKTTIESPNLTTDPLMLSNVTPITVTVEGFHISKGSTGIRVQSGVTANILNNVICSNESRGVLLNIGSAYCTVVSNHIFSNSAQNYTGNGVYLNTNFGGARVDYNVILGNNGDTPYGIFARSCSNLVQIRYNTIVSNISARTNTGGGIRIEDTFSEIIGNTIQYTGSNACEGGGIVISNIAASTNFIADNIITHHLASNYSYGIYVITNAPASLMTISNNSISSNGLSVSSNLRARGIFVAAGGGTYIISDNTIAENHDRINCGGIGVHFNTGTTANAVIERNTIVRSGQSGITAFSSGSMTIRGNIVRDSGINMSLASGSWEAFGIYAAKSSALIIDGNTVTGTTSINVTNVYGISVGTNATIINNIIVSNMPPTTKYAVGLDLYGPSHFSLVSNNRIAYNIGTNTGYGIQVLASVPASNRIVNNVIINNRDFGVFMSGTNRGSVISSNNVSANGGYGIYIGITASSNRITGNSIAGNRYAGIMLNNAAVATNYICSNIISGPGQEEGINLSSCPSNLIFRNVIANHLRGVSVVMANSNDIFNNTMYNNGTGIDWSTASNVRIVNNIIFGSTNVGVYDSGASGGAEINYTVFYNNALGDTNISARHKIGPSNVSGANPYVDTFGMYDITSPLSMAVDRATNIPGITSTFLSNGPDMGWKESLFSLDQALVVCSITNPPANQWIGTPVLAFSGTAGASVTGVYFGTNSSLSLVSGTAVWTTNGVDVSAFANGTNVFFVAASNAGGTLFTNVQTNYFDFTPPELVFTAPTPLTVISNVVTYQGSNIDPFAPVTGFWYNVNGGAWTSVMAESNWSGSIDTTQYPNGLFVVGIRSSNAAGLTATVYTTNFVNNIPLFTSVYKFPTNSTVEILVFSNDTMFGAVDPPGTGPVFAGEYPCPAGAMLNAEDASLLAETCSVTGPYSGFRYRVRINDVIHLATNANIYWKGSTAETAGGIYVWRKSTMSWVKCGVVPAVNGVVQSNIGPIGNFIDTLNGTNYMHVIATATKNGGAGDLFCDYFSVRIDSSPGLPDVNNDAGASNIMMTSAALNGQLAYGSGTATTVRVFWGASDGGATPASWANMIDLGMLSIGGFSTNVYGLSPGSAYYYRAMASNIYGTNWADVTSNFTTKASVIATNVTAGGAGYASLQAAVNAASAGHEIRVLATNLSRAAGQLNALSGTNALYVTNKNNLSIIGGFNAAFSAQTGYTVLDGLGETAVSNRLVYAANLSGLTFKDFVIHSGGSNAGTPLLDGTGLFASNVSFSHFTNIIVSNCVSSNGGGMFMIFSMSNAVHAVIADNDAVNYGGGLAIDSSTSNAVSGVFRNNTAKDGGGIYLSFATNTFVTGSISSNSANGNGGGIDVDIGFSNTVAADVVSNFNTSWGGGVYFRAGSYNTVTGLVSNNYANYGGGFCYYQWSGGVGNYVSGTVVNNSANDGGGVYVLYSNPGEMNFGGIIAQNTASASGGGVHLNTANGAVITALTASNSAGISGGGIFFGGGMGGSVQASVISNSAVFGGGIAAADVSNLTVHGCFFSNNHATGTNATVYMTNVTATNSPVSISNCVFYGVGANAYAIFEHILDITNQSVRSNVFWTNTLTYLYGDPSGAVSGTQLSLLNTPGYAGHDALNAANNIVMPVAFIASNRNSAGTFYAGYGTIQEGILAATNGDTVFVISNGVYNEALTIAGKTNIAVDALVAGVILSGSGQSNGITVSNAVLVTVSHLTVTGYTNGIVLAGMSNTAVSNTVHNNMLGIVLDSSANSLVGFNTVFSNTAGGIIVTNGSSVNTLRSNAVYGAGQAHGVYLRSGAQFTAVEHNFIAGHGTAGVKIDYASNNSIAANDILTNSGSGIEIVWTSLSNSIIGNRIRYTTGDGIWAYWGPNYCSVLTNEIADNTSRGISSTADGWYIAMNEFRSNDSGGVNIVYGGGSSIVSNHMHGGDQDYGITLGQDAYDNTAMSNLISGASTDGGIVLDRSTNSTIVFNRITGNMNGIVMTNAVYAMVSWNTVCSNQTAGIDIRGAARQNTIASNDVFGSNQVIGVRMAFGAFGNSVFSNRVAGNSESGVMIISASNNSVASNMVTSNGIVGIYLEETGARGNTIAYNTVLGAGAQQYGIAVSNGTISNFIATNIVSGHAKVGVYLLQATNSKVGYNTIVNNLNGVFSLQGSNVSVQFNNLTNNLTNFAAAGNTTPVWIESNYYGTRTASNAQLFGLFANGDPWVNSFMNFFGDWTPPRTATNGGASNNAAGNVVVWWEPINTNSDFSNWVLFRATTNAYSNLTDTDIVASIPYSNATALTDTPPSYGNYWYYLAVRDTNGNESFYVPTTGVAAVYVAPSYAASNTNTGSNYTSIQAAVNAAGPNETVVVFPGTYNEEISISLKAGLSLIGYAWLTNNNIAATILDGAGLSNVGIYADRVTNCTIAGLSIAQYSNGIYMINSRSNTIGYNRFFSNMVAGISLWSGDHWNTITSNDIRAVTNLHGIYLSASSSNLISSNSIGESTNGVTVANTSINNEIRQNTIYSNIDGVNLSSGTAAFTRVVSNDIAGNYNRGVVLPATPSATIAYNAVHGCVNPNYAAITVGNSALMNIIANNAVYDNGGSGIGGNYPNAVSNMIGSNSISNCARYGVLLGSSTFNSVVSNRIVSNAFAGIYISNSVSNVCVNNIIGNNGTNGAYVLFSTNDIWDGNIIRGHSYGSGMWFSNVVGATVTNAVVTNNTASNGGGFYSYGNTDLAVHGVFANNRATNGGGLYIIGSVNGAVIGRIAENRATSGGGIWISNAAGVQIAGGICSNNAGLYGGGIYAVSISNTAVNASIFSNSAYGCSAVSLTRSASNSFIGSVYNNIAGADGTAIYAYDSSSNNFSLSLYSNISAAWGSGLMVSSGVGNTISGDYFGNIGPAGAAVGVGNASNTVISGNFYGNESTGVGGAAIRLSGFSNVIRDSVITNNWASGGIHSIIHLYNAPSYCVITNCVIAGTNNSSAYALYEDIADLSGHTIANNTFMTNALGNLYHDFANGDTATTQISVLNTPSDIRHDAAVAFSNRVAPVQYIASNSATGALYASVQEAIDASVSNYTVYLLTNAGAFVVSGKTNLAIRPSTAFNRISGTGTSNAVVISNSAGVSVSGLVIHGWMNGIVIGADVSGTSISNMTVVSNAGVGVIVTNALNTTLFANAVCSNAGDGILVVSDLSNVRIDSNNLFMNGGVGLSITATNGVAIVSNEIISNGNNVSIIRVLNGVVARNLIALSSGYGVYAESGASNLILVNNTLAGNAWNALDVQNSATVYTTNNIFYANGQYGIQDGNFDASRHDFNNFHANSWGVANFMLGGGTITGDPHLDQSAQYQITNAAGRAVDAGVSNNYTATFTGYAPDIGWRESPYSGTPAASNTNTGAVYMTVAGALNAAGNGHTVAVLAGTYAEKRMTIEKDLTVIGWPWFTNGNNAGAVFDGGVSDYIFQVTNSFTVNIIGLTISNSGMGGNGHVQYSGGASGRVMSNRIGWGMNYGVKITDARPEVSGNHIENMQGVGISGLSPAVVVSNYITGGTGVQCSSIGMTNWRIAYNRIISNWTGAAFSMGNAAGGVFMSNSFMSNASAVTVNDMSNLIFTGNTFASNGVGVSLSFSVSNAILEGGMLSNNSNAVYLDGAVAVVVRGASIIGSDTAFAATNVSAVTFTSNTVAGNAAAIVLSDVSNTVFILNHIASNAAGIVLTNGSTANIFRLNDVYSNTTNIQYIAGNSVASNYYGSMLYADVLAGVAGTNDTNVLAPYRFGYIGTAQADTAAPAVPQFTAVTNMTNGIALYWNNTGGDTAGYRIYRSVSNDAWTNFASYFTNISGAAVTAVTDTTASAGATNYYFVTAYDGAVPYLNESWFSASTNGVRQAPTVTLSFTNPAPMAWVTNTPYTIQGWASNDYGQITGIWFSTNAAAGYNLASGTTNWTTNINVSTFPITNVFYAVASNEYGYVTTNYQTNLVDTTLPFAQLTNVASGGYISGVFTFRGTNYDAQSGIFGTRIVITNTVGAVANIDGLQNTLEFTNQWNSAGVADGRYFAYVSTTNNAGMLSNGASTMFLVNNLAPDVRQTNITQLGTNTGTLSFIGYATNAFSGIDPAAVYMMTNGGAYSLITNGTNFATNFNSALVAEGTNIFIFAAVSSNFKTNTWYQTNIIDNSAPISVVTNYVHGSVIAGTVNIRGTNFENWSSVTANVLYTNDAFFGWTAATAPWSFTINTASFTNGVMKLALVTSNSVGLVSTNIWSNYVSNAGPTLTFTNPAPMVWITNTTYAVQGWASNTVGELYGVWLSTNATAGYNLASGTTNWTTNINVSTFPITNVFYAVASNEYGYVTTNHQTNLVDTTLPYAALTNVTSGGYVSGVFTFRGTNYDAQSGIFGTRIVITNTAGAVANIDGLQNTLEFTNQWNSVGVADGRYYAYVSTTNNAGMLSNGASTMFVVNNLAPDIRQTNIAQLGTNTGTLAFIGYATNAWSGIDPAAVYMMTNGGAYSFITNGTNFASNFNSTLVSEGTNIFIFAAVSSNFKTNTWYQTNIIDNSAPISVVTNYVHGSVIAGTVNIRGTNFENWSTVTANVLYTNDAFFGWTASTAPWSFALNSALFTNGVMRLALVTSNGVNLTFTNTWSNYVSNSGPTISFTNPAPMVWITNTTYAVQGWASNTVGELYGVWFSTNATAGYNLASGTTNWTTNINVSTFPITNVFYAVASNEYGYVTTNYQTNLVDTTLPYAALTNVTSGGYVSGVFTFRGTNYDAQSGIFGTRIVITNTAGAVANIDGLQNTLEFTNQWNSAGVADGRYFAYVSTTNNAGMLSNGASTMFVVNNLAPDIRQTNIAQLGTNTGTLNFIGYATNAFSGIDPAAVYMMTNGGAYAFITNGTNFATNFSSTLVSEGTNIFIFAAVSSNFKTNTWYQTNIIDNSAPISVVTNYVHGSVIAGTVNIRGTNFENWSSVTANVLYTNDAFFGWTASTAPWSFALNSALFTNGVMKLALVTSNSVGLVSTNIWSNYVSNAGPTLAFTNPAPMVWITNTTYAVQGWASNTVGELYGVWFSTNATAGYNLASGTTNWTTNVDVSAFPMTNVFYAVASNEYGYVTTNYQTNLVDTTLPFAQLTNVTSGGYISGVFTFRGTNYDAQSGIFGTRIVITNTAGAVANIDGLQNTIEFTNQWNSAGVADGRYFAYVSTTNNAGMLSNGASTMFVVNNLAPDIRQTNIAQLGTNTGTLNFIGYATNAFSGIDPAAVYMMTNGGAYSFITNGTNFATNFNSTLVAEGTNIFIFAAVSSNFKTNTWYQTNIIDNSAPISVVTNYVHGSVIAGGINIRGTNFENWSSVTANVLYTNDAFFGWTAATAPWSFALNSALFTNGVVKLALVTSNSVGLAFTNTWSNYASNGSLTAAFTSDKTNVYTYTAISFSDLSTSGLSITNWLWSFGDGSTTNYTSFVPVIAHTYTQMTTCWVTLTVWDALGSNTISNQYVISNQLPSASFTRAAVSAAPFITNYFTNTSADADGIITNFRWEFGDGVISNGASFSNMTHRYTNGGSFSVVLTVWDNNGGMASNSSLVTIGEYAAYFVIYGTNAMVAGDTNEITMIACAPDDSRAAYFNGYKSMTFGGALNAPDGTTPKTEGISFGSTVFVYFTNGYATNLDFTMALYRAGAWTITASDGVASTQPAGTNVFTVTVSPGDMHKDTSVISASPRPGSVNTNVRVTISGYDAYKNKTATAAVPAVTVTVSGSNSASPPVVYAGGGNYTADYTPTAAGEDIIEAYLGGIKILSDADGTSDGVYHLPISAFETARITDLAKKARDVTHGGSISVFSSKNPAVRGEKIDIYYEVATNSLVSIGIYDMSGKLVSAVIENKQSDVAGVNIAYNVPAPTTRGLYLVAYTSVVNGVTQRIYWKLLVK